MLLTGASAGQIRARAREEGMVSMWRDGLGEAIGTPDDAYSDNHR